MFLNLKMISNAYEKMDNLKYIIPGFLYHMEFFK